jgi:hypothetical protein
VLLSYDSANTETTFNQWYNAVQQCQIKGSSETVRIARYVADKSNLPYMRTVVNILSHLTKVMDLIHEACDLVANDLAGLDKAAENYSKGAFAARTDYSDLGKPPTNAGELAGSLLAYTAKMPLVCEGWKLLWTSCLLQDQPLRRSAAGEDAAEKIKEAKKLLSTGGK